jgi:hypothetical protein
MEMLSVTRSRQNSIGADFVILETEQSLIKLYLFENGLWGRSVFPGVRSRVTLIPNSSFPQWCWQDTPPTANDNG